MRNSIALVSLLVLAACQPGPDTDLGQRALPITGGQQDVTHEAVCAMKVLLPADPQNPQMQREEIWCTCTLIEERTVLTAAACVADNLEEDLLDDIDLRFGISYTEATAIAVTEGVVHRYFDADASSRYNLAMLRLETAPGLTPATLNERTITEADVGTDLTLVGFGTTDDQLEQFGARRSVTTPITVVDPRFVFAGTSTETSCEGDSGGPGFVDWGEGEVLATVNVRQGRCFNNAQRTRVDPFLDTFIYPYIDRFSGACPLDTVCDDQVECRSVDPDCEPCAWDGETCAEDCPTRDWDCELGSFTGQACATSGECEEQGTCIAATDEPEFTYCASPCDPSLAVDPCPGDMFCADLGGGEGQCTHPEPSPGSQGYGCSFGGECRSGICEEQICVNECDPGGEACPGDYTCGPSTVQAGTNVCLGRVFSGGGGFCNAGAGESPLGPLGLALMSWLALGALVLRRRS
jgi:hypothetical protein